MSRRQALMMKKMKTNMINKAFAYALIAAAVGVLGCTQNQSDNGEHLFAANCSACHGAAADGTNNGPPLVHRLYEPGHHADFAFYRAVSNGVIAHHWNFGDMPPVSGLSEDEVAQIISYVRDLQREGGIIR